MGQPQHQAAAYRAASPIRVGWIAWAVFAFVSSWLYAAASFSGHLVFQGTIVVPGCDMAAVSRTPGLNGVVTTARCSSQGAVPPVLRLIVAAAKSSAPSRATGIKDSKVQVVVYLVDYP